MIYVKQKRNGPHDLGLRAFGFRVLGLQDLGLTTFKLCGPRARVSAHTLGQSRRGTRV